jgi:hypothetical protein
MFGGIPAYFISMDFPGDITNAVVSVLTLGLPPTQSMGYFWDVGDGTIVDVSSAPGLCHYWRCGFLFPIPITSGLEAGHNAKSGQFAWFLWSNWKVFTWLLIETILGIALLAAWIIAQLKFNHLQITYYTCSFRWFMYWLEFFDWKKTASLQFSRP